jgi:DNA repair protein RadC
MPKVCGSREVEEQLRLIWSPHLDRIEEFLVLCLNRANRILGWAKISQGGLSGTVADPKVIFQVALKSNACSIILAHNHPSGNVQPSEADIQLTRKLKDAGVLLDLPVLDHLILTSEGYYSFADEGLL